MATIRTRQRKDGSLAYLSEVRVKRVENLVEDFTPGCEFYTQIVIGNYFQSAGTDQCVEYTAAKIMGLRIA